MRIEMTMEPLIIHLGESDDDSNMFKLSLNIVSIY
jgi:hypothetical protein